MKKTALVLEGGSMRCLFTVGVLDSLMREEKMKFDYVNGVSAGSMSGINYLSNQPGRTAEVNLEFIKDSRYLGVRNMISGAGIFNFDFLFEVIASKYLPFDWETFNHSTTEFEVIATNCETGKPEIFNKKDFSEDFAEARASSSMPLVSKMVDINGGKYLDGGCSLAVGYQRALDLGYEKVVVILTREQSYRKKPIGKHLERAYKRHYREYPQFVKALMTVPERYNEMKEEITELEKQGRLFVFRPEAPINISRIEKNRKKLEELYVRGQYVYDHKREELYNYLELD